MSDFWAGFITGVVATIIGVVFYVTLHPFAAILRVLQINV